MLRSAVILLVVGVVATVTTIGPVHAKAKDERYHVRITGVETKAGVTPPASLPEQTRTTLDGLLAARPRFVRELSGAPDRASAEAFTKFLTKNRLRAYDVVVTLSAWEHSVAPDTRPGKSGQLLTVRVSLDLFGAGVPEDSMALSGQGSSTVKLEIGSKLRPRDDAAATEEALTGALEGAIDEALVKLSAPPASKPDPGKKKTRK